MSETTTVEEADPAHRPMVSGDVLVDGRDASSPGPLSRLIAAIAGCRPGQCFEVLVSDRASREDILDWLGGEHHELLGITPEEDCTRILVRKRH